MTDYQFSQIRWMLFSIFFVLCVLLSATLSRADEPEIIDYGYTIKDIFTISKRTPKLIFTKRNHPVITVETTGNNNSFDVDVDSIKISCPQGYRLNIIKIRETRTQVVDIDNCPGYKGCEHDLFDYFTEKTIGAELKCIKEK